MRAHIHVWGQDPTKPGRVFAISEEVSARLWCETNAPSMCGYAFLQKCQRGKFGPIELYNETKGAWV